jgi:hypothetical protein
MFGEVLCPQVMRRLSRGRARWFLADRDRQPEPAHVKSTSGFDAPCGWAVDEIASRGRRLAYLVAVTSCADEPQVRRRRRPMPVRRTWRAQVRLRRHHRLEAEDRERGRSCTWPRPGPERLQMTRMRRLLLAQTSDFSCFFPPHPKAARFARHPSTSKDWAKVAKHLLRLIFIESVASEAAPRL